VSDSNLLRDAIAASGLSQVAFAGLLCVDPSTVRRWLSGAREVDPTALVVCRAIIRDPRLVASLAP
jgi:DNA-binding transcriptional regulator YiaG